MDAPPPPPPPHGANAQGPKSGGLPDGKYDIFVIPPSSAGAGFLYLPSLQTHRNSFLAGVACTAAAFFIWSIAIPVIKEWFKSTVSGGGSGVIMLMVGVAVVSWAWGKTQGEGVTGSIPKGPGGGAGAGAYAAPPPGSTYTGTGPTPHTAPPPPPPPPPGGTSTPPPKSSWQRPNPQANTKPSASSAKSSWEKAREETRKKEEERRKAEELKKRREDAEKERVKQREKDAREREERERKEQKEKEEKREKEEKAAAAAAAAKEREREKLSPKKPPNPTVRTENEDDAYSFRPYDRPKKPVHKANSAASMYSESSYAASQTTAKTTPPPSTRGPYMTKDPDKIIIKAVYAFNNAFMRTPISQLLSGQGNVTDGLILRITTEGLFIDDDVRGVPQREWDIKAWTMKLAEVWCPNCSPEGSTSFTPKRNFSPLIGRAASRQAASPSQGDSAAYVDKLVKDCIPNCRRAWNGASIASTRSTSYSIASIYSNTNTFASTGTDETLTQSCEMMGLHILRANIRDQEGKKYVFVISQSEGWKVAIGLQRLRRGTQVRALAVSGLPQNEAKALIENLGWA